MWRMANIQVQHVREQNRFEATDGAEILGRVDYHRDGEVVTLSHTVVEPAAKGQGVGSTLARTALDEIRAAGRKVDPQCPFIAGWIERHPEYADLVAENGTQN